MKFLTTEELAAIRARADAATKGPWDADWEDTNHWEIISRAVDSPRFWIVKNDGEAFGPDFDFAAHSREDVPALLDYIEALKAELKGRENPK